ncbi:hypothetical protein AX774_g75 [Zancudomyces culisetae]|uniref:Uncharacterized protein n=1 Tax=Zancudomyces culisetae TaxID=1213189 RepID=A0A1R1PZJ3_ZANCU|nr:hypothetical protein AX774_g75 [Zancudomyces culisetae]|eukprot:OMH86354.1 hypothetical protein AX774_g75 [Zancudomyces culisetae]
MADKLDTGRFDRSEDPTVPFQYWNPMSYLKALNEHRERINLPKPGQFDQLNKESKGYAHISARFARKTIKL